jgi:hypothetical protein
MEERTLEQRQASAERYYEQLYSQLKEEALAGDSNTLDVTFESGVWATTYRCINAKDFPEIFDYDMHSAWFTLFLAAQNYDQDNMKHDKLLRYVLYARSLGPITKRPVQPNEEPVLACTSNRQRIWVDLPYLVEDFHKLYAQNFETMSPDQRVNISAFIARLLSAGVCDNAFAGFALILIRQALETPKKPNTLDSRAELPMEAFLPALRTWFRYAPHHLKFLSEKSFNDFENNTISDLGELALQAGVHKGGFSPERWTFWKSRLEELKGPEAKDEVYVVRNIMDQLDRKL